MRARIRRWDGEVIEGVASRGPSATFAALDWRDLVPGAPELDLAPKVKKSSRLGSFEPDDRDALQARDGVYSDLQSINSEDTVTWAAFRASRRGAWLASGLREAFQDDSLPENWTTTLWSSSPGPSPDATPPEADADLRSTTDKASFHITVESKWKQDLKDGQDVTRSWNQLDMRAYVARGPELAPSDRHGVLVLVPPPALYAAQAVFSRYFEAQDSVFVPREPANALPAPPNDRGVATTRARALTWSRVAELADQAGDRELGDYLRWRLACFDSVGHFLSP